MLRIKTLFSPFTNTEKELVQIGSNHYTCSIYFRFYFIVLFIFVIIIFFFLLSGTFSFIFLLTFLKKKKSSSILSPFFMIRNTLQLRLLPLTEKTRREKKTKKLGGGKKKDAQPSCRIRRRKRCGVAGSCLFLFFLNKYIQHIVYSRYTRI